MNGTTNKYDCHEFKQRRWQVCLQMAKEDKQRYIPMISNYPGFIKSPPKSSIKSYTISFQTSFNPCLYSSGSPSVGSALVESSNYKIFYTQLGHCGRHNVFHIFRARIVCSAFHSISKFADGLTGMWGSVGASRNLKRGVQPLAHENAPG